MTKPPRKARARPPEEPVFHISNALRARITRKVKAAQAEAFWLNIEDGIVLLSDLERMDGLQTATLVATELQAPLVIMAPQGGRMATAYASTHTPLGVLAPVSDAVVQGTPPGITAHTLEDFVEAADVHLHGAVDDYTVHHITPRGKRIAIINSPTVQAIGAKAGVAPAVTSPAGLVKAKGRRNLAAAWPNILGPI